MVKDYQSKREYLVLSLVKKYPLYSLNKLNQELPEFSRHSIQRILEKNNLSTVEKRLAFSTEKKMELYPSTEKTTPKLISFWQSKVSLGRLKNLFKHLQEKPRLRWQLIRNFAIFGVLVLIFWQGISFILARPPDITLEQPEMGFVNEGEKLFVIGKVLPTNSRVTVNGNQVSLNGDGSFTAVVNIPMGESILELEAVYMRREAKILRLVKRIPTQEELQAQAEEEEKMKRESADKAAELERTVKDLMAAKSAVMKPEGGKKGLLRILNNRIKGELGFSSVIGEVINLGEEAVSWVMITAKFLNEAGKVVDTKYGFATDFGEVIEPGEKAEFETQITMQDFDHYSLELSWEEETVAGVATEAAETKPSEEIEEESEE